MSAFVASDDDLFVLRRFERLGARVALMMQDRLASLEEDLLKEDKLGREEKSHCGTFRHEPRKRRSEIMDEIKWRLIEYQKFILDHSALKARPDANNFQIENIKTWLKNNNNPVTKAEIKFINKEGDLMPMVPKIKSPLRRFIDRYQIFRRISCFRVRKLNSTHYGHDDEENYTSDTTVYSDDSLMDKFVTCITIALGLAMLIGPLWLLQHFTTARLVIITVFLVVFTLLLTIITVAKPFETLAASAAYGAVLMVFMQLGGS
ncbi:MAG: hypothetical protein HETSPECPRED_002956 [Heterodermia speciosa]|uniref:DUF6594 domain-containing protein n=1 Tax=Heterodermia speciosa TaxID=116794 RepID=A0A8H3F1G3_9LECA|nr:MAG: hypothetical protein HETSPECPRED_002956 [Heterodermia speciosa]